MQRNRMSLVAVLLLSAVVGGCGKQDGRVSVRGTVTYRGRPLPVAHVAFHPTTPGILPSYGVTNSDGRYELMTFVPRDGASVGTYRVAVLARGAAKKLAADAPIDPMSNIDGPPLIPIKYFTPGTSGLTADVKPGGITADFDLK